MIYKNAESPEFEVFSGVLQGAKLDALLFLLLIDDLPNWLQYPNWLLLPLLIE